MNAHCPSMPKYRRLIVGGLLLLIGLFAAERAGAAGFTVPLPMPAFTTGTTLLTQNNPTLGTFDFSSTPYSTFTSITSLSLTLALYDLQTMASGTGAQKRDYNNLSLTLAGLNTGILLNGYDAGVGSTVTVTGTPLNSSAIVSALISNNGLLSFGILDATSNPSNSFDYFGGTASMTLNVTQVPFSPSTTLGLVLVGAFALIRSWPGLKRRFSVSS
jgi:hypothetical protein